MDCHLKNIKYDSNYLAAIKILENFEKENINIFSKTVKKYIQSRKTNCFHQFILRSLCYDNKKLLNTIKILSINQVKLIFKIISIIIKNKLIIFWKSKE